MEATVATVVTRVERVTTGFTRVQLQLREPGTWETTGVPDEFVHLEVGAATPDGTDGHTARHYTVSGLVEGGLEIEVALHGHGPGALWGERVTVGDEVLISEAKAYYAAPEPARRRILIGDATALPAIARILAEADAAERFTVVIELGSLDDARELASAASVEVAWRVAGNGGSPSELERIARELIAAPNAEEPEPYVWVAGESAESRRVRGYLRTEAGLPLTAYRIVGYWHADLERQLSRWDALPEAIKEQYASIWRDDRTDEENWLELEPFLQRVGL